MKEKFSKEQIDEMLKNSTEEIVNDNENLVDEFGNVYNANEVIKQAEIRKTKLSELVNLSQELGLYD